MPRRKSRALIPMEADVPCDSAILKINNKLWSSADDNTFYPVSETCKTLPPDVYTLNLTNMGPVFNRLNYEAQDVIRFEESVVDDVVNEIQTFWKKEKLFKQFDLPFRRGILLWGPQGSGKTTIVKLVVHDIIKRGGIAIKFTGTEAFTPCMRVLREIQPNTPIIVIMEDLEVLAEYGGSSLLNMLDGIGGYDKMVFLATTNYPEHLDPRMKNRPSRFDRRYEIGYPGENTRKQYFEHLLSKSDKISFNIEQWVKDTNRFSIAHLKELFISVNLFGRKYEDALKDLRDMSKNISSEDDCKKLPAGFMSEPCAEKAYYKSGN
jgi:AAA+ superfamily predicted ATPase